MNITRRRLIVSVTSALGGEFFKGLCGSCAGAAERADTSKTLRILFLGGTGFIGPHMVRGALNHGHRVTLFTRGRSGADLFPEAERLIGDRAGQLESLHGNTWDVVIDNSGFLPEHVQASAELLKDSVGHYLFTSATDVYRDYHTRNIDESYPLATLPVGAPHDVSRYYGPLKALCERVVTRIYPNNCTIVRPGWIVGPGDGHRLEYWIYRMKRGGEFLAPESADDPLQFIYVRDLAQWVISMAESQKGGPYNAVGPSTTWGRFFQAIQSVTETTSTPTWVDATFLKENKVVPYFDLPMWWPPRNDYHVGPIPAGVDGGIGAFAINENKARNAGLTHRPLSEMLNDTFQSYKSECGDWQDGKCGGLTAARERELLTGWWAKHRRAAHVA